jgi:2-isopropylmalate synthase
VHLYNATAPVMRRVVLGMSEDEIVELAVTMRRCSRTSRQPATDWTFEYSPEMYSDTELDFPSA